MTRASIIMSHGAPDIDGSVRAKAWSFLSKLVENDAAPGLHVEKITNAVDPRVRTGRVDDFWRAVLFRLDDQGSLVYVVHGIWPHDEANARAQRARLGRDSSGIPEIRELADDSAPQAESARPLPDDTPTLLGHTPAELVAGLGISERIAEQVARCTNEDELLNYAAKLSNWQGLALIDLVSGKQMSEIRAEYDLASPEQQATLPSDDAAIVQSIKTQRASQVSFQYVDKTDDLRRIIESGGFNTWRTWLHPNQRRAVDADYNGPYRLAGGAGTGKTVVLLHRARRLAQSDPSAKILATTFTTNLSEQMRNDLALLDPALPIPTRLGEPGVLVNGIDSLASAVLNRAGESLRQDEATLFGEFAGGRGTRRTGSDAWEAAAGAAEQELRPELRSTAFLTAEYNAVVLPNRITKPEQYLRVRRPGRGTRLSRPERKALWKIFEAYRARASAEGSLDYAEAAALAAVHLERVAEEGQSCLFDHVLVDEGQDLGPCHLQLVRALVASGRNDVFIAEDSHQRIYNQRIVFSHYGLNVRGRSTRLTLNYRTTAENLALAQGILSGAEWVDSDEQAEKSSDYRSVRRGPTPKIVRCPGLNEEYDQVAEIIGGWLEDSKEDSSGLPPEALAILVRERWQRDAVTNALAERNVQVRSVDRGKIPAGHPVVMTMHRSKGTEFARVLLSGISEKSLPKMIRARIPEEEKSESLLRERALLYVAATRARDELVVTYNGPVSPLMPKS